MINTISFKGYTDFIQSKSLKQVGFNPKHAPVPVVVLQKDSFEYGERLTESFPSCVITFVKDHSKAFLKNVFSSDVLKHEKGGHVLNTLLGLSVVPQVDIIELPEDDDLCPDAEDFSGLNVVSDFVEGVNLKHAPDRLLQEVLKNKDNLFETYIWMAAAHDVDKHNNNIRIDTEAMAFRCIDNEKSGADNEQPEHPDLVTSIFESIVNKPLPEKYVQKLETFLENKEQNQTLLQQYYSKTETAQIFDRVKIMLDHKDKLPDLISLYRHR